MAEILQEMKGFRNALIHEYAKVDDEIVFETATTKLEDFLRFKKEILKAFKTGK